MKDAELEISRVRETLNLLLCADSNTNTKKKKYILQLFEEKEKKNAYGRQRISWRVWLELPIPL